MNSEKKPTILLIDLESTSIGGQETHVLGLYNALVAQGHSVFILASTRSPFHKLLIKNNVRVLHTSLIRCAPIRFIFNTLFERLLKKICSRHNISVIHCNNRFEVPAAVQVKKKRAIKVIFTRHVPSPFALKKVIGVDALTCVNPATTDALRNEIDFKKFDIKTVKCLPPLWNAQKFLEYKPEGDRNSFFKQTFDINLKPYPVISMIGNMVPNLEHKNYPLLLKALETVIHKEKIQIQAILVGDGPARAALETMGASLGISDHLFFVGSSTQIPGTLYHSDIFVLASSVEAFGIVHLEAGLMRKPSIGAYKTGAESIIIHEQTGLLFKNGDSADLARCIKLLVSNPTLAQQLGTHARTHILENFAPGVTVARYEELY